MIVCNQNDHSISIDEWCEICNYEPDEQKTGIKKIETEKAIIFISVEDYKRAENYLSGNRPIPSLEKAEDILGDIYDK